MGINMAAGSLLSLLDDIATLLDDVAVLSKVAAKKTVGVIGDDLALNAEQVSGVKADRELPVVWAVAKGSFLNKFILVPSALLISAFAPLLIIILLVIGGLYLCFEGFEKVAHKLLHSKEEDHAKHQQRLEAISDPQIDLVKLEQEKIKGAIRTDFILSAEIIVIVLGSVQSATFGMQVAVVSTMALLITIGVYGLVAGIVKMDDAGYYLLHQSANDGISKFKRLIGKSLLIIAPKLMKLLSVLGTIAMFLVGGGIVVHNFPWLHHHIQSVQNSFVELTNVSSLLTPTGMFLEGLAGIVAGGLVLLVVNTIKPLVSKQKTA